MDGRVPHLKEWNERGREPSIDHEAFEEVIAEAKEANRGDLAKAYGFDKFQGILLKHMKSFWLKKGNSEANFVEPKLKTQKFYFKMFGRVCNLKPANTVRYKKTSRFIAESSLRNLIAHITTTSGPSWP